MSFRRVGWVAAIALATLLDISCGQTYRPVVIPTSTTPPDPANFHAVFGISANVPFNPGTALQIDVSGDTNIGVANMGINPTHAAILPNNSRVFIASAGSMFPGDTDVVTAFFPAGSGSLASGLGTPTNFNMPNVGPFQSANIVAISEDPVSSVVTMTLSAPLIKAQVGGQIVVAGVGIPQYDGSFLMTSVNGTTIQYVNSISSLVSSAGGTATVPIPLSCSYLPDFVATSQTTAVYAANYGVENDPNCNFSSTDSVAVLNPAQNTVANIVYLPAGSHPIAMTEPANAANLYVLNQGSNTVMDLSPQDLSTLANIPIPNSPVWAVSRPDSLRVYVLTQGDGLLYTIDTAANAVIGSPQSVGGPGANFVLYDKSRNRLYVTNPTAGAVYVFDATPSTPSLLGNISLASECPNGCAPVSVAALPDGTRFYVASYESEAACPDPNIGTAAPCIIPRLTVFDALSLTVKPSTSSLLSPSLSLLSSAQFSATQYAVPILTSCVTPATYTPAAIRFRMFTTASADSSHVYVSICDAGAIADIRTNTSSIAVGGNTPDTLVTDVPTPFGVCSAPSCTTVAAITGFSITSNVVTFQAANSFVAGQRVSISGLSTGTYLNGQTFSVLGTGLTAAQFECDLSTSTADVQPTVDSGNAGPLPPTQAPILLLTGQ